MCSATLPLGVSIVNRPPVSSPNLLANGSLMEQPPKRPRIDHRHPRVRGVVVEDRRDVQRDLAARRVDRKPAARIEPELARKRLADGTAAETSAYRSSPSPRPRRSR